MRKGTRAVGKTGAADCCCGALNCECPVNPSCITTPITDPNAEQTYRISGTFQRDTNGFILPVYQERTPVTCCAEFDCSRHSYSRFVRRVSMFGDSSSCAGHPREILEIKEIVVNGAGTRRTVIQNVPAGSTTCVLEVASDVTHPFGPVCVYGLPGNPALLVGWGDPRDALFYAPNAPLQSVSGTFSGDCHNAHQHLEYSGFQPLPSTIDVIITARPFGDNSPCVAARCVNACCLPDGSCRDDVTKLECVALGGIPGMPGSSCWEVQCDQPGPNKGACCNPASGVCGQTTLEGCQFPNIFRGLGTICTPNPCDQPTGACCVGQNCSLQTQAACVWLGGMWQGPMSTCSPTNPCAVNNPGACCHSDGSCTQVLNQSQCMAAGDVYFMGGDCNITNCQAPNGACCSPTGHGFSCAITTQQSCEPLGTWYGPGTTCTPDPCGAPPPGRRRIGADIFI